MQPFANPKSKKELEGQNQVSSQLYFVTRESITGGEGQGEEGEKGED